MKKYSLLLSLPLVLGLVACGGPAPSNTAGEVRNDQVASNERAEQQRENAGDAASTATDKVGDAARGTGQAVGNAGENAKNAAGGAMQDGAQTSTSDSKDSKEDASSDTRRRQLNSDIRAREQRTDNTGKVSDGDIESKVRSKLEANIQQGAIAVTAADGNVTLKGRVPTQADVSKAVSLAKEINGVKQVQTQLTVSKG